LQFIQHSHIYIHTTPPLHPFRFLNVPFSFMVQLSVGSVYGKGHIPLLSFRFRVPLLLGASYALFHSSYPPTAWSVFNSPLTRELGVVTSAADDWGLSQVLPIFSTCALTLGVTTAFLGRWSAAGNSRDLHLGYASPHTTNLLLPTRAVGGACWPADGRHGGGYGEIARQWQTPSLPHFLLRRDLSSCDAHFSPLLKGAPGAAACY
jgi:hypothetical protein